MLHFAHGYMFVELRGNPVEVDILPPQAEYLASTYPGEGSLTPKSLKLIVGSDDEEGAGLTGVPRLRLRHL